MRSSIREGTVRRILSAVILAALIANAHADERLTGIKQIALRIEKLDDDNKKCGITEALLSQSVTNPLSNSRIQIVPPASDGVSVSPYLYVYTITVMPNNSYCVTSLVMEVIVGQPVHLRASGREVYARIVLWSSGSTIHGAINGHSRQIESDVESQTKRLITAWDLANK
jgi:hypothetical protein